MSKIFCFEQHCIGIDKPADSYRIVPTPQIIQPRLLIKHIPAIAERLHLAQRFRQFTGTPQRRAPRIVAVAESRSATDLLDKVRIRHMEQFFLLLGRFCCQPVGGLCEGHRTRRAGKFSISILLQFRKSQCLLTCSYINIRYAKLFFIFNTSSIVFNN